MKHTVFAAIICLVVLAAQLSAQSRIQHAVDSIQSGDYDGARRTLKTLIYSPGEDQEAALYLMIRVELADGNPREAMNFADRLLSLFPRGDYVQYAHFGRAEAFYLLNSREAAQEELNWVVRNATDRRLTAEAERALEAVFKGEGIAGAASEITSEFEPPPASGRYSLTEGRVALLLSFPDPDDPSAADLQRGFRFAADYGTEPFPATIARVGSPFEAAGAARDLMNDKDLLLLLFAGDEGSAMAVTLLSREYGVPVVKLNTSAKSFTEFSPLVFELLPSTFAQARSLGEFATNDLHNDFALVLTPEDETGRAGREGFMQGVTAFGGSVDAVVSYPSSATAVRKELAEIFSAEPRMARGESPLKSLLSKDERERLFGSRNAGEVLEDAFMDESYEDTITTRESFYFSLSSENIDNFSSQLSMIPKRTTLFGNSSWIDVGALERQASVTEGMYISVPLLPSVSDTSAYVDRYVTATGAPPGAWELLGIDAGEYVGFVLKGNPSSRRELAKILEQAERFDGLSVVVDFNEEHENQYARILQHRHGNLQTIR
ncbi:ABC transporter substrate-binding protein [bacterium]|nr:ABC transporter substrate-binding protein [bacterium]